MLHFPFYFPLSPEEMSIRNLPGGKGWPTRKADNFTAICEPTEMWDPNVIVQLEGLSQLKNPIIASIETAIFRLVA
jgi:hypothetical protein